MSEVKPAMTPEEWAEFIAGASSEAVDDADRSMKADRVRRDMAEAALTARRLDAAAALALYHQPFGFTWEDVDLLREAAANMDDDDTAMGADVRSLADRLAALLPPRE